MFLIECFPRFRISTFHNLWPRRMIRRFLTCLTALVFTSLPGAADDDWRVWRGPNANGVANSDQRPPTQWSKTSNIVWKSPVPGRGHSSPIVVGNRIFLTTADESNQVQSVLCYDRTTGQQVWKVDANRGGFSPKIHNKNTHASPTIASDGERVFAVFNNNQAAQLTALTVEGDQLWQKNAGGFVPRAYQFGYAPSPLLFDDTVIVASEFESAGFLAAFDVESGNEVWRRRRPPTISYSSPIVGDVAGRQQLLISGCKQVAAFDPSTGTPLWSTPGIWTVTCATVVWNDDMVFASGGYPDKGTMAVRADGSGEVVWQNRVKCYEQSMLVHNGFLYGVDDGGVAYCWRCNDGKEMWKRRLGGNVSSSPILARGNIYLANEGGTTFVFRANPDRFEPVAKNQLGTETFATPAFCGNQIFTRVATRDSGKRQEFLVCIGNE